MCWICDEAKKTIIMPQYQIFMYKLPDGVTSSSFTKKCLFGNFVIEINLIGKKRH